MCGQRDNKINPMLQRLGEVITERTLSVEVKCVVNETVIDNNFKLIVDCLRQLEEKQAAFDKKLTEVSDRNRQIQKHLEDSKSNTLITGMLTDQSLKTQGEQTSKGNNKEPENTIESDSPNQSDLRDLIQQLREDLNKECESNKNNYLEHIKDVNVIMKDVSELKGRVDGLQSRSKGPDSTPDQTNNSKEGSNLENIRIVQNELHRHSEKIDKIFNEMDKAKSKIASLMDKLKHNDTNTNNGGVAETSATSLGDEERDQKLNQLKRDLENLTKRFEQSLTNNRDESQDLNRQIENVNLSLKELEGRVGINEEDIAYLKERTDDILASNVPSQPNNQAVDASMDRGRLEKDLRRLEENVRKDNHKNEEWKRKTEENIKENQFNIQENQSRIEELDALISNLQKDKSANTSMRELDQSKRLGSDKLPALSGKKNLKLKSITREESSQKSNDLDKKIQELRSELHQWVKQILDARGVVSNDSAKKKDELIDGIDLKIQELKMLIEKKADNEGVKKYLSFLDNKINQIWNLLSQPDTEDALIARKGWGCLSCAKKLEKYRGKIGDHLNWNNMTTTNYSPPRVGYSHTGTNSTAQNFTIPVPKTKNTDRHFPPESEQHTKEYP